MNKISDKSLDTPLEVPGDPLSPKVIVKPLNPSKSNVFSVNETNGGNYILTLADNDANMQDDETDKDFFSEEEYTQTEQFHDMTQRTVNFGQKRTHSASGVDVDELGQLTNSESEDRVAKSARVNIDANSICSNKNDRDFVLKQGKTRILIVKSTDNLNIFSNPNQTLRFLKASGLDKIKNGPHEVQGRGGCLKLTVTIDSEFDVGKISKFENYNLKAWFPTSDSNSVGIIFPVDKNLHLNDIVTNIKILDSPENAVIELKRLQNKMGPTDLIKIIFEHDLPSKVSICGQVYSVRKYNRNPLICYRCSRWGHGMISCTRTMKCGVCGGNHMLKDCTSSQPPKCLSCNNSHLTGFKNCDYYKEAVKIEKLRSLNKITYDECKDLYRDLNDKKPSDIKNSLVNKYYLDKSDQSTRNRKLVQDENKSKNDISNTRSNYYEVLSDLSDGIDELEWDDLDSNLYNNPRSYAAAVKSKNRKVRKRKTNKSFRTDLSNPPEFSFDGNCMIENSEFCSESESHHSDEDVSSRFEIKRKSNNNFNSNKNSNLSTCNKDSSKKSPVSFWFSIIKKIFDFLQIKDKSTEVYTAFGWVLLNDFAQYFNFEL